MTSQTSDARALDPGPFDALLFDMDGTLISSLVTTERVWMRWAARHGLDARDFLPSSHGQRAIDTIRKLQIPGADVEAESALLTQMEIDDTAGITAIAGARAFVDSLPRHRWAVVTSAPRALANVRLAAGGIPLPDVVVTADDVTVGKPDPSGYRLAASKLGVDATRCAVFEDALAGIRAGEAAGSRVVVITATHDHPLQTPHPAFADYAHLTARVSADGIRLVRR